MSLYYSGNIVKKIAPWFAPHVEVSKAIEAASSTAPPGASLLASHKRANLGVNIKLYFACNGQLSGEAVNTAVDVSLAELELDVVDTLILTAPVASCCDEAAAETASLSDKCTCSAPTAAFLEAYSAAEELVAAGKVVSLGVAGFSATGLSALLDIVSVVPSVLHVPAVDVTAELAALTQEREITLIAQRDVCNLIAAAGLGCGWLSKVTVTELCRRVLLHKSYVASAAPAEESTSPSSAAASASVALSSSPSPISVAM